MSLERRPRHAAPALMLLLLLLRRRQAVAALVAAGRRGRRVLVLLPLAAAREAKLRRGSFQRAVVDHEVVLHNEWMRGSHLVLRGFHVLDVDWTVVLPGQPEAVDLCLR